MIIRFHPHAVERMDERGTNREEVENTIEEGDRFPVKYGRTGFLRNFIFNSEWHGKRYNTKQVEVYVVEQENGWLVITVISRYF